jgi:serine/threonine protein kinase
MITSTCPSRETLFQYSVGMLYGEQRDALDEHLDCCPDCQATIVTLDDADDTVISRLRTPLSSESVLAEPQLQDALATAMAMPVPKPNAKENAGLEGGRASDMPETLGEYQLLEELGRGGMGRVYKALHTKLDRVVAVKVLPRGRGGDQKAIVRFEREMKAVGRLAHPNIVQAYDAREIDDTPVLVMEFVDGLDLAKIVRRVGSVPIAEACELVRQTAFALQCAYEHGLVHRDIKPSNIMLARSGEVKLLDLGLARFYAEGGTGISPVSVGEEMTSAGQAMGTADYMAPEQTSDSRKVDIRADLYSLGCPVQRSGTPHHV